MKNGGSFHSYVTLPEGKPAEMIVHLLQVPLAREHVLGSYRVKIIGPKYSLSFDSIDL